MDDSFQWHRCSDRANNGALGLLYRPRLPIERLAVPCLDVFAFIGPCHERLSNSNSDCHKIKPLFLLIHRAEVTYATKIVHKVDNLLRNPDRISPDTQTLGVRTPRYTLICFDRYAIRERRLVSAPFLHLPLFCRQPT